MAGLNVTPLGPGNWFVEATTVDGRRWTAYGATVEQGLHQIVLNLLGGLNNPVPPKPVDLVKP